MLSDRSINSAPNPLALKGLTVSAAAKSHPFDLIQSLLARGDISDEHRGAAAIVGALHNPSLDFFQILLSRGSISDQHRADAIVYAAAAGHKLIIGFLLTTGNISLQ